MNIGYDIGQDYTGIMNFGHQLGYLEHGIVKGLLTYPGPNSGGYSSLEGNCDPIIAEVGNFIKGGTVLVPDDGTHQPKATFDGGICTAAGWVAPGTTWLKPLGPGQGSTQMSTDIWAWVKLDGSLGAAPPTTVSAKVAAQDALDKALITASAAAAILRT